MLQELPVFRRAWPVAGWCLALGWFGLAQPSGAQPPSDAAVFDPPAANEENQPLSARQQIFRSMGFRRITDLGVSIAPPPGRLPDTISTPPTFQEPGTAIAGLQYRYGLQPFFWESSALCHRPIYFEDWRLERAGRAYPPLVQFPLSAGLYYSRFPAVPALVALHPPWKCVYTLGYGRPSTELVGHPVPFPLEWTGEGPGPAGH
jgi:hypothetical protein